MKLHTIRFEPTSQGGEAVFDVPTGAAPVMARMSKSGHGELVVSAADNAIGTETMRLLFMWEGTGHDATAGGESSGWRHVGSWEFRNGSWQHCFARVAEAKKRAAPAAAAT